MEVTKRKNVQTSTDLQRWIRNNQYVVQRDAQTSKPASVLYAMIDDFWYRTQTYTLDQWEAAIDAYLQSVGKAKAS